LDSLLSDDDLLTLLKWGLAPEAPDGVASSDAATKSDAMARNREADQSIKDDLINCVEFAKHQMARFMICDPYIDATREERKQFFRDVFTKMMELFQLIESWGSQMMVDAYEDNVAFRFAELLGITQVDLLGEVLFDERLEEFLAPPPARAGDTPLPMTIEERSSGDSRGSMPASESYGTWVLLPLPEKGETQSKSKSSPNGRSSQRK
jgi:hypothetical protein